MKILAASLFALLLAGCGGSPFAVQKPDVTPALRADYTVEVTHAQSAPGEPVELNLKLTNTGTEVVYVDCADPTKRAVVLNARTVVRDVWPPYYSVCLSMSPLFPGKTMEWTRTFDGTLYQDDGTPYTAATGDYTILSVMNLTLVGPGSLTVEDAATFHWTAGAP